MTMQLNRNSTVIKTLLIFFPIALLLIISSIYVAMDSHYTIVLTEDFTQTGQSDENNFGIIFADAPVDLNSPTDLQTTGSYKNVIIPYNQSSGRIEEDINQPKDDHIVGFYNQHVNNTNFTTSTIQSYNYQTTDNITKIMNHTYSNVEYVNTGQQDITDAKFDLIFGQMNRTGLYDNMSFYPPPPLVWEDIHYNDIWYEFWTPNASLLNQPIMRLYIPFRYVPSSSGRIYVQIYNVSTVISLKTLFPSDIYNPSYSIVNVLDTPFIYHGGNLTIKVWTNEYINWWSPIQVATQTPRSTNSTMQETDVFLGIPFTTNYPNKCFFKGWTGKQNLSMPILSEAAMGEERITFNLTVNLGDYGISAFNLVNFTWSINDLYFNLTDDYFIDGNVCYYNWNTSTFYNFANGSIYNTTYSLAYLDNTPWVNDNNQIVCQIVLRGDAGHDFYMMLYNLTFSMWSVDVTTITDYYVTYTIQNTGYLSNNLFLISNYTQTDYGYIYTETIIQHILINQTVTLTTSTVIFSMNETLEIEELINREIVYYLHNIDNQDFDIAFNYYNPFITVDLYREENERVIVELFSVKVYF